MYRNNSYKIAKLLKTCQVVLYAGICVGDACVYVYVMVQNYFMIWTVDMPKPLQDYLKRSLFVRKKGKIDDRGDWIGKRYESHVCRLNVI